MSHLVAHVAALTHRGLVRSENEDVVVVNEWICADSLTEPQLARLPLDKSVALIVCDGMGGYGAGEVASDMAAKHLAEALKDDPTAAAIERSVTETNQQIFEAATDPALKSMGTTVAGLWLSDKASFWFNVGDSSVIRFANGFAMKLSLDDVLGGERTGAITQALGGAEQFAPVKVHIGEESPRPGWTYLICSDGLTDMVQFEDIEKLLIEGSPTACGRLLEAAMEAGAADNVSIIVATIVASPEPVSEANDDA